MLAWIINLNFRASAADAPAASVGSMKRLASPRSAGSMKVRG